MPSKTGHHTHCLDCRSSVDREGYRVHDELWVAAGMSAYGGLLCIGCLERRLGRRLTRGDFAQAPINDPSVPWISARLKDRLTSH